MESWSLSKRGCLSESFETEIFFGGDWTDEVGFSVSPDAGAAVGWLVKEQKNSRFHWVIKGEPQTESKERIHRYI